MELTSTIESENVRKISSLHDNSVSKTKEFFHILFGKALEEGLGEIEIRVFKKNGPALSLFYFLEQDAADKALTLAQEGEDVYFGVNLRVGKGGKKENVRYLNCFHAEVDYGKEGHKKQNKYESYEECLKAIEDFQIEPTVIVHSGGGFHCYWVLAEPLKVEDYGIEKLERINRALTLAINGDLGTQDISRVLRVPGTYNYKNSENPRPISIVKDPGKKYTIDPFIGLTETKNKGVVNIPEDNIDNLGIKNNKDEASSKDGNPHINIEDIENLPVSEKIKFLIKNGNDGTYLSRSEADMAVITALVNKGVSPDRIKEIFVNYPIGEKYRSHNAPDSYLFHTIEKAKEMSNLTEEEMVDPLFISGAINKNEKGYFLNIVRFEEYMVKKYRIKVLDKERAIFRYNGKCYEQLSEESLNNLCQKELGRYRHLFKNSALVEFIHYVIGEALMDSEKARNDQINYLTLQNGLYDLKKGELQEHNSNIFTTNLLPYDYNPEATCPRFTQFLNEIFLNDQEKIGFIQEAVGYVFHQALPTPAIFFLLGEGSNGKSVFINTIIKLVGEKNACNISFNKLSDEYYILELFQKMINISGETPQAKKINTDVIKAVVAGDWVTGRQPYKQPMKFRSFAKNFLATNRLPNIDDTSHGMWRRIIVIDFPRIIKEEEMDRQLEEKLSLELSGIFNWAMKGYRRLRDRGFRFVELEALSSLKEAYREQVDNVRMFVKEHLQMTGSANERVRFSKVYDQYLCFCQKEKRTPESKLSFKKRLEGLGFKIEKSKKDSNQVFIFGAKLILKR